jgi:ketosteroid isomerase-like protein
MRIRSTLALAGAFAAACAALPNASTADLRQQVIATEKGFAQTMARRDFAAFTSFLAEDTLFFDGERPLRGKAQVAADWKKFYEKPEAPFSWEPAQVEVLDNGTLAISSGPVRNAQGKVVASFTSIWQRQNGGWKIIFDKGNKACD